MTLLEDLYPGSAHVFLLDLHEEDDIDVWGFAQQNDFSIVTKDADFSDLCLLKGFPPKVIWIRLGNCLNSESKDFFAKDTKILKT